MHINVLYLGGQLGRGDGGGGGGCVGWGSWDKMSASALHEQQPIMVWSSHPARIWWWGTNIIVGVLAGRSDFPGNCVPCQAGGGDTLH